MPTFLKKPLLTLAIAAGLFLLARLILPTALFDALGLTALESAVWSVVAPFLVALGVFEVFVLGSAVCDYRDAKLVTVGWRQAWAVAHLTVWVRGYRRARWAFTGARGVTAVLVRRVRLARAERAADREYIVLDPSAPFDGVVLEHRDAQDEDAA